MWSPNSHPLKPQAPASAASTAHSCDPELTPDEQNASKVMLRCPYSKDHVFREEYMVKHALECRKAHIVFLREQGLALKVFSCKHNPEHEIPRLELYIHEEYLCPDRPAILRANPAPSRTLTLTEALPVTNTYFPPDGPFDPDVVAAVDDGQASASASARNGSESESDTEPKPSTSFARYRKSLPPALGFKDPVDPAKMAKNAEEIKRLVEEVKSLSIQFPNFQGPLPAMFQPPEKKVTMTPPPPTPVVKAVKKRVERDDDECWDLDEPVPTYDPMKRFTEGQELLMHYPANLTRAERKKWKEESVKRAEKRRLIDGVVYGSLRAEVETVEQKPTEKASGSEQKPKKEASEQKRKDEGSEQKPKEKEVVKPPELKPFDPNDYPTSSDEDEDDDPWPLGVYNG